VILKGPATLSRQRDLVFDLSHNAFDHQESV
jgi:hypothetical protein